MNIQPSRDAAKAGAPAPAARLSVVREQGRITARPQGEWLVAGSGQAALEVSALENELAALGNGPDALRIDLSDLKSIDTSGAWLIVRLARSAGAAGTAWELVNAGSHATRLIHAIDFEVGEKLDGRLRDNPLMRTAYSLGRVMNTLWVDTLMGLNVIGAAIRGPQLKAGRRGSVRPISIVHHIDRMGLRAVPIVTLMSFLIGAIIAQQSAFQLRVFGLEVWSVDLVGILLLREVGVLLTAIMVAGRSGSAMTAEIGSMKMREEVDALTVIGLNPIGVLVFPRLVALTIALPLLTFLANMAALAGACIVLRFYAGVSIDDFILRLRAGIDLSTVFSGLIKAPFMALIIGTMAAVEGMKVEGSAESLGRRTTSAVVKAIFFVIVVDGLFAMFYAAIDY
ncbi:MAG: ABC transporter permease [Phyllobacteriaceae bacterium]|nr:ABC transporter permease [Phyllobacteriaceae bacterium]